MYDSIKYNEYIFKFFLKLFNILSKDGKRLITGETLDLLSKDELRQILLILERYEPSNTYTYEYSYVREQDIR